MFCFRSYYRNLQSYAVFQNSSWGKKTEKSTTLLWSLWKVRSRGKLSLPELERQTSRCRESALTRAESHEWKPLQKPVPGQENLSCDWQIIGVSVWTSLWNKNSRRTQSPESHHTFVSFTFRVSTRFSQDPHVLSKWRGKCGHFENRPEHFALSNKAYPTLGKEKTQLQFSPVILSHWKGWELRGT